MHLHLRLLYYLTLITMFTVWGYILDHFNMCVLFICIYELFKLTAEISNWYVRDFKFGG